MSDWAERVEGEGLSMQLTDFAWKVPDDVCLYLISGLFDYTQNVRFYPSPSPSRLPRHEGGG
jgi:hypothetical protein